MTAKRLPVVPLAVAVGAAVAFLALALFVRDHAYRMYGDAFIYLRYVRRRCAPIAPDVHFLMFQRDGE